MKTIQDEFKDFFKNYLKEHKYEPRMELKHDDKVYFLSDNPRDKRLYVETAFRQFLKKKGIPIKDGTIRSKGLKIGMSSIDYKAFNKWMLGQTVEMDEDGTVLIFESDFLRWLNRLPVID